MKNPSLAFSHLLFSFLAQSFDRKLKASDPLEHRGVDVRSMILKYGLEINGTGVCVMDIYGCNYLTL